MSHGRFQNPVEAALTGFKDLFAAQPLAEKLTDDLRLDGRTALVTGASSGLGFAVAGQLAERGARVLMVSRSGIPEKGDAVRQRASSDDVEQIRCDLSDLDEVHALADHLRDRGERIDVVVDNAGVATPWAKKTPQGFDAMFATNYLAKFVLLNRLLADGVIANQSFAGQPWTDHRPRIILVSSDSHRGASAIDWEELGTYYDYGVNKGINNYSYFKLVLNTFGVELSRRLGAAGDPAVHVMCPGPVNSNILRDAPGPLYVFLKVTFTLVFRSPEQAAKPVVYMATAAEFGDETGRYLHMFRPKRMDDKCYDPEAGARLWSWTERALDRSPTPG